MAAGVRGTEGSYQDSAALHLGFLGTQDVVCGHHTAAPLISYESWIGSTRTPGSSSFLSPMGLCHHREAQCKARIPHPGLFLAMGPT